MHEVDGDGEYVRTGGGKMQWRNFACEELTANPTQEAVVPPNCRYVARVRAIGVARDGSTKLPTGWAPLSQPVSLIRRMGGGFSAPLTAAAAEAMQRAKKRASSATVQSVANDALAAGRGDGGIGSEETLPLELPGRAVD